MSITERKTQVNLIGELHDNPQGVKVGQIVRSYLNRALNEPSNPSIQYSPFVTEAWGDVLSRFTRDLGQRLDKARSIDDLASLVSPIVTRGAELVSGGVISGKDLPEGERRGLIRGGTWPDAPGAHFWDPREQRGEQKMIQELVTDVLQLDTNASELHVGRVITMSLPALISWADLRGNMTPKSEMVEAVRKLLNAEKSGSINTVAFGCEPYQYKHEPNTTTSHFRRSQFGNEQYIRPDAIHGSFRAVRRILEPISLSGVDTHYQFYTSFGSSWELIQRQVMPDTINFYRTNSSADEMLGILNKWRQSIEGISNEEFSGSKLRLSFREMESQVVLPALRQLASVLYNCGMSMPEDVDAFCYNSEKWFSDHRDELNLLTVMRNHPDPRLLINFLINEEEWSCKHPDAYESEPQRITQSGLLSFFEQHQYERINQIINSADLALGVEIDEELIMLIRERARNRGEEQSPLIWGRPPRYTNDGIPGGVGHRQPWYYG